MLLGISISTTQIEMAKDFSNKQGFSVIMKKIFLFTFFILGY